jgi:exodeoxyribonuclease VII small subunit
MRGSAILPAWPIVDAMARKNQTPPKSFEEALKELEQILVEIESGDVGLEQSLNRYERGTFLLQHCRQVLNRAEKQIEQLTLGPDKSLQSEPLAEDELSTEEEQDEMA